jgi:hypothetical protein
LLLFQHHEFACEVNTFGQALLRLANHDVVVYDKLANIMPSSGVFDCIIFPICGLISASS